jgi:hypothetical protein
MAPQAPAVQDASTTDWFQQNAPPPAAVPAATSKSKKPVSASPPPSGGDWFNDNAPAAPTSAASAASAGGFLTPPPGPTSIGPSKPSIWDRIAGTQVPGTGVTLGEAGKNANDFIRMAGTEATALFAPPAAAAAPLATAGALGAGYVGGKVAKAGAKAVGMGETGQELSENVGNLVGGAAGVRGAGALETSVLEPRRIAAGRTNVAKGLGIPAPPEAAELAGKGAPDKVNASSDLDMAHKDLAQIERQSPVTQKGSAGTFQRAKNMIDYANQLWEDGHQAPISRNVNRPINPKSLTDAGQSVLTEGAVDADPAGARRSRTWLTNQMSKPRSLGAADELLRELNNDIEAPAAQERYGNTFLRVKSAVAKALRSEIENTLGAAGETGVKDVNTRYGAIRNLADNAIDQALAESKTEGKAGMVPDWVRPYVFVHGPGGMSGGVSLHAPAPKSSAQFASGMTRLSRSNLAPPPISGGPPPAWMGETGGPTRTEFTGTAEGPSDLGTKGQGGTRTKGLLLAPPTSGAPPNAVGRSESVLPPNASVVPGAQGGTRFAPHGLLPAPPVPGPYVPAPPVSQVGNVPPGGFPPTVPDAMWHGTQPQPGFETPTHMTSPARPNANIKGPSVTATPPPSRVSEANVAGASREAAQSVANDRTRGITRFRRDTRSGIETPLVGVDARDPHVGPFDEVGYRDANGHETVVDRGPRARQTVTAPATGVVGRAFKESGLTNLITGRQAETLETMVRGPRWRDLAPDERRAALMSIIKGERF